jgi:O-antigen/teichoic acid export membrane protein
MGSYAGFTEMITRFFTVLLFPVTLALHPRIMNLWNEKKYSNAIHLLKTGLITQSGLFLIVLLIYVVFKDQWLLLLFAVFPDLDSALINIIIPIMFGGFLWQFALLVHKPLEVREKSKLMLIFIFLSIAVNIIGNMVFLPKVGVIATAYTMVVSGGVYLLFTMLASSRFWMVRFGK